MNINFAGATTTNQRHIKHLKEGHEVSGGQSSLLCIHGPRGLEEVTEKNSESRHERSHAGVVWFELLAQARKELAKIDPLP